jgi:hypothetical protein
MHVSGDLCTFRDVTGEHKLTGIAPDGVVQYEVNGKIYTTDASEITHNYHEAARTRASLEKALEESAKGETEYLGDFSQYA